MKRRAFLRVIGKAGCMLNRRGKKHDIYVNPANGRKAPIPRHTEISDTLCELIQTQLGINLKPNDETSSTSN